MQTEFPLDGGFVADFPRGLVINHEKGLELWKSDRSFTQENESQNSSSGFVPVARNDSACIDVKNI